MNSKPEMVDHSLPSFEAATDDTQATTHTESLAIVTLVSVGTLGIAWSMEAAGVPHRRRIRIKGTANER
jgi:hypothetical protein